MGRAFEVRKESMAKTAAARSKVYSKYGKEIYMAAKLGVPDPDVNVELRRVIERAKKDQVTNDVINRAIEKAKGGSAENYSFIRYEGFGPNNSLLIIDCLTDNTNRSLSDVRTVFNKFDCKLGVSGSVLHQFYHRSYFELEISEDRILEILLENDVNIIDVEKDGNLSLIYAEPQEYANVRDVLNKNNIEILKDEITFIPLSGVTIKGEEELSYFEKLILALEDLEDVTNVYHNVVVD